MLPTKAEWDKPGVAAEVRKRVEDDGADVNEAGPDGRTVLMNAAAFSADPEAISYILLAGAKPLAVDSAGKTALHHCAHSNTGKIAASYAASLLKAGCDPRTKDAAGISALEAAKKRKNAAVLPVLEAWQPPPPDDATLASVRANSWYNNWTKAVFLAVDKAFDADAATVDIVGILDGDDEAAHNELSALMLDLEAAYKSGTMGGGTFRQCSQARVPHAAVVGKLSKLEEEVHALVVYCAPGKRDGIAKKIAKYNEKCGSRIAVAWAAKEDPYPIE